MASYILNGIETTRYIYGGVHWPVDNNLSQCDPPVCRLQTRPCYCLVDNGGLYVTTQDGQVYYLDSDNTEMTLVYPINTWLTETRPDPENSDNVLENRQKVVRVAIGSGVYPWRPGVSMCDYQIDDTPSSVTLVVPYSGYVGNPKVPSLALMELPFANGYYVIQNGPDHCVVFYNGTLIYDGMFNGKGVPLRFGYGKIGCNESSNSGCCPVIETCSWEYDAFPKWKMHEDPTFATTYVAISIWECALSDMGVDRHGRITVGNVVHSSMDDVDYHTGDEIHLTVLPFVVYDWNAELVGDDYACLVCGGTTTDMSALKALLTKEIKAKEMAVEDASVAYNALAQQLAEIAVEDPRRVDLVNSHNQLAKDLDDTKNALALVKRRLASCSNFAETRVVYREYGYVLVSNSGEITGYLPITSVQTTEEEVAAVQDILASLVGNRVLWSVSRGSCWASPRREEMVGSVVPSLDYDFVFTCTETQIVKDCSDVVSATQYEKTWYSGTVLSVPSSNNSNFKVSRWKEECCRSCDSDAQAAAGSISSMYRCGGADCGLPMNPPSDCGKDEYPITNFQEPIWKHIEPELCVDEIDSQGGVVRESNPTVKCNGEIAVVNVEQLGGRIHPVMGSMNHWTNQRELTNWAYVVRSHPKCRYRKDWTIIGEIVDPIFLPGVVVYNENISDSEISLNLANAFVLRAPHDLAHDDATGFSSGFPLDSDPDEVKQNFTRFYPAYLTRPGYEIPMVNPMPSDYDEERKEFRDCYYNIHAGLLPPPPDENAADENGIIWRFNSFREENGVWFVVWDGMVVEISGEQITEKKELECAVPLPTPLSLEIDTTKTYEEAKESTLTASAGKWYRGKPVLNLSQAINPPDPTEEVVHSMTSGVYWKQAVKSWGDPNGLPIRMGLQVGDVFYSKNGFGNDVNVVDSDRQPANSDTYWFWTGYQWTDGTAFFSELEKRNIPEWVLFYKDLGRSAALVDSASSEKGSDWGTCFGDKALFVGKVARHQACGSILAINLNTDSTVVDTSTYHKAIFCNSELIWERKAYGPHYQRTDGNEMFEGMNCVGDTYVLVTYNVGENQQMFRLWMLGSFYGGDPRTAERPILASYFNLFSYEDVPDIMEVQASWVTQDIIREYGDDALKRYIFLRSRSGEKWYLFYNGTLIKTYISGDISVENTALVLGSAEKPRISGPRFISIHKCNADGSYKYFDVYDHGELVVENRRCGIHCWGQVISYELWSKRVDCSGSSQLNVVTSRAIVLANGDAFTWASVKTNNTGPYTYRCDTFESELHFGERGDMDGVHSFVDEDDDNNFPSYPLTMAYLGDCNAPEEESDWNPDDQWTASWRCYAFNHVTQTIEDLCNASLHFWRDRGDPEESLSGAPDDASRCAETIELVLSYPDCVTSRVLTLSNFLWWGETGLSQRVCTHDYFKTEAVTHSLNNRGNVFCGVLGAWYNEALDDKKVTLRFYEYHACGNDIVLCAQGPKKDQFIMDDLDTADQCVFSYNVPGAHIIHENGTISNGTVDCSLDQRTTCGDYVTFSHKEVDGTETYRTYFRGNFVTDERLVFCCPNPHFSYGNYAVSSSGLVYYGEQQVVLPALSDQAQFVCCGDALLCCEEMGWNLLIGGVSVLTDSTLGGVPDLQCCGVDYYILQTGSFVAKRPSCVFETTHMTDNNGNHLHEQTCRLNQTCDLVHGTATLIETQIITAEYTSAGTPVKDFYKYEFPKTWAMSYAADQDGGYMSLKFPHDISYQFTQDKGEVRETRVGFVPWAVDFLLDNREVHVFYKQTEISHDPRIHEINCFRYRNVGDVVPDYRATAAYAVFYDDPWDNLKDDNCYSWSTTDENLNTTWHTECIRTQSVVKNVFGLYDPIVDAENAALETPCGGDWPAKAKKAHPNVCLIVWEGASCSSRMNHDNDRPFTPFCDKYATSPELEGFRNNTIYISDYNSAVRWDRMTDAEPVDEWQNGLYRESAGTGGFWISAPTFNFSQDPNNQPFDHTGRLVASGNSSIFVWDARHGRLEYSALTGQRVLREEEVM